MTFYIKNNNKFIPIESKAVLDPNMNNKLIVMRVGSDEYYPTADDLDATAASLSQADVVNDLNNTSIIITPFNIDIEVLDQKEADRKTIYIQIRDGDNVEELDAQTKSLYNQLKGKYKDVVIVPSPISFKDYQQVQDIKKRCDMRKKRRIKN